MALAFGEIHSHIFLKGGGITNVIEKVHCSPFKIKRLHLAIEML